MFPVIVPLIGAPLPVPIDAHDIVRVDRSFGLGPKLFLKDGRWVVTTPEALAGLEKLGVLPRF
jgi:hypothetical protein